MPASIPRISVLSLVALLPLLTAADWPQWRGPQRNARSPEMGVATDWESQPPKLLWMTEGFGGGYASVAVANGRIFTTGNQDDGQALICADEKTGRIVWQETLTPKVPKHGYQGSRSTPSIDGDRVYTILSSGMIACCDVETGRVVWKKDFAEDFGGKMMSGWGFSESPLVDGDWVLCTPGGANAMMVALDKRTGREIWRASAPPSRGEGKDGAAYSSIVVSQAAGVKQYVQLVGRGLIGVRASDGQLLWSYNRVANDVANIPTPIAVGDYVFASTGYGTGSCLVKIGRTAAGVSAQEVYFLDARTLQNHHGGLIRIDDYIYTGHKHNNGFPICVNWKTGKVVWGGDIRGVGKGSAAVVYVDGHLIFRYQSGEVALIEATPVGYRLKGSFMPAHQERESWAHPVVSDGRLYLREQNKLMCYDLR